MASSAFRPTPQVPPRKMSIEPTHPYYSTIPEHKHVRIWVNGVEQSGVVTYDQDEGWVERHKPYEMGFDIFRLQGEFEIERVNGDIKVEWKE